jgi:hypothetical protein
VAGEALGGDVIVKRGWRLLRRVVYWAISLAVVVGLLLGGFYGVGLLAERGLDYVRVMAGVFVFIGAALIVFAIGKPGSLYKVILRKEDAERSAPVGPGLPVAALGAIVAAGGIIYGLTSDIDYLILMFFACGVVMFVLSRVLRSHGRKE